MKVNYPLIDQVKSQFTLTIELISITKRAQMLLLTGNILWKIWIPPLAYKVSKEIILNFWAKGRGLRFFFDDME